MSQFPHDKKITPMDIARATHLLPEKLILARPLKKMVENRKGKSKGDKRGIKNRRRRRYD